VFNSHRFRSVTAAGIAVLLAFGTGPRPIAAQQSELSSIEVRANPELAPLSGTVKISGRTGIDHKTSRTVKISVKTPDGAQEELTAEADKEGNFSAGYETKGDGDHIVEVTSPGGKDHGKTKFTVVGQKDMEAEVQAEHQELAETARDALATVEALLNKMPVSPARDEVTERLKPLKEKVAQLPAQSATLGRAMQTLHRVVPMSTGLGPVVYTSVFNPLSEWHREAKGHRMRIKEELARSKQAVVRCDSLNQIIEALNFLSFCLTFGDKPFGILAGFAKVYDSKKISALEKDPAKAAMIASTIKSIPDILLGPIGLFKIAAGLTTDAATFTAQQYFAKYCEKFEGPIKGSMEGEYLKDGVAWRTWSQKIGGRLTIRYSKPEKDGDAIRVSGEFVGKGASFTNWDNAIPILFKKLEGTYTQFRRTILPKLDALVSDLGDQQGQVANALGPGGFRIPIEGELVDRKLKLHVLPAATDMRDLSAKVVCFLGSPFFLGFINNGYELQFSTAHHMISGALGVYGPEETAEMDVVVDVKKKVMKIEREFKATRGKRTGKGYAAYSLTLNLSNPP
jgi:hypothetical protein